MMMLKNLKAGLMMNQLPFRILRLRNLRIGTTKKMEIGLLHQFPIQNVKRLLGAANGSVQ
jgi:hypothetical protein